MARVSTQKVIKLEPAKVPAKPKRSAPKAPRRAQKPKAPKRVLVMDEIRAAFRQKNLLATFVGLILGGFVPVGSFLVIHYEVGEFTWHGAAMLGLAIGGLVFSAKTVWQWAKSAFADDAWKATGFVILLEGLMTLSGNFGLSVAALVLLTAINAIATGVQLSRG